MTYAVLDHSGACHCDCPYFLDACREADRRSVYFGTVFTVEEWDWNPRRAEINIRKPDSRRVVHTTPAPLFAGGVP